MCVISHLCWWAVVKKGFIARNPPTYIKLYSPPDCWLKLLANIRRELCMHYLSSFILLVVRSCHWQLWRAVVKSFFISSISHLWCGEQSHYIETVLPWKRNISWVVEHMRMEIELSPQTAAMNSSLYRWFLSGTYDTEEYSFLLLVEFSKGNLYTALLTLFVPGILVLIWLGGGRFAPTLLKWV